jgi:triacylglycerol lipase
VWFAGHSLGAALATLAADRFPAAAGVCTIGSPRVGDRAFAAEFDARFGARALRFVNDTDIVTHVPTPFPAPYEHVGQLRQISADVAVTSEPPALAHFVNAVFGNVGTLKDTMNAVRSGRSAARPTCCSITCRAATPSISGTTSKRGRADDFVSGLHRRAVSFG